MINLGFWEQLKKPIMVLAPMADVTDAAFRRVIAKYGKPDVMWTEFVSADGLFLGGGERLIKDLAYTESERPIIAQFFTAKPELMKKAAELATELGFDGIDINMGCPDKGIERQGAGAAMIKNPKLAREVLRAAIQGAKEAADRQKGPNARPPLPVSVKTRLGFNKNELETWLRELLSEEPAVITIHARTRKEMSKVAAHWDQIKRAVEIRDEEGSKTLIFGNGDAQDIPDALAKARSSGADGIMLGRAIFGNPFLFSNLQGKKERPAELASSEVGQVDIPTKLKVLIEHTKLFEELLGGYKNFAIMKKHYKAYVNGWPGCTDLRASLMEAENATQVEKIILQYLETLN